MSYESDIVKVLARFGKTNGTANPDEKHNTGALLGEAFMWDKIAAYAENKSKAAWEMLAREGIIPEKKSLEPGEHQLAQSPSFAVIARVTQPIKRFSGDELAKLFAKSRFKVPISTTKEFVDDAKVPSASAVTLRVVEKS